MEAQVPFVGRRLPWRACPVWKAGGISGEDRGRALREEGDDADGWARAGRGGARVLRLLRERARGWVSGAWAAQRSAGEGRRQAGQPCQWQGVDASERKRWLRRWRVGPVDQGGRRAARASELLRERGCWAG